MKVYRKILTYANLASQIEKEKARGKSIVFVTGCFDMLHAGHLIFLDFAKSQGDILIVGVGSDQTIKRLKGPTRPVYNEVLRSRMLAALECVDYVVVNDEDIIDMKIDFSEGMSLIQPHYFVCPYDDKVIGKKQALVEQHGGKLIKFYEHKTGELSSLSTTALIREVQERGP